MVIINKNINQELNNLSICDTYILTDFDGTIAKNASYSSWASIFKNPNVNGDFVQECERIYNYYHKYEINENIPLQEKIYIMRKWYEKNIETLKNFKITEEIIKYSANTENAMCFRDGAERFLSDMNRKEIPIVIISAGVGNIIQQFLINNKCNYPNIYICSNFLEYENGIITGIKDNNVIHPLNKNKVSLPKRIKERINNRNHVILFGNSIADLKMASTTKIIHSIGFLDEIVEERMREFQEHYDVICTNDTSFDELQKILIFS